MPLTEKQREYLRHCNHRWNVKTGATGSGKSFVDFTAVIPKRILASRGEGLLVLLGNTRGTLERNILEPMRQWWPGNVGMIRSDNTVEIFGHKVYALGADNKKHVARIQGATFEYVYGDEVTTWSEDVFQMLKSRLRCPHSYFDGTCNPDSPHHWFKRFLDSGADIYQQSYTIDDNPYLSPAFVENLKREYEGTVYYQRFILGRWANAQGLVYPFFADQPARYLFQGDTRGLQGRFFVSIDYGTHNPCSMGLWCVQRDRAIRVKESYYDSRADGAVQRTDEEHYQALEVLTQGYYIEAVVVDPSAASFIETIRRHNRFRVYQAANDVLPGIQITATLLQAGKLLIHDSCRDAIREFSSYSWDDASPTDRVIKDHDHAMDDIRYFAYTVLAREFRWTDWRGR